MTAVKTSLLVFLFLLTRPRISQALSPLGGVHGCDTLSSRWPQLSVRGGGFGGRGGGFSSSSRHKTSTALKETSSNAVDIDASFEESVSSMQLCARNSLLSFLVDALTNLPTLMEAMPWSERMLSIASAAWKLNLGVSLYQFSAARVQNKGDEKSESLKNLPEIVDSNYRYMARMWRQTAFILVAETATELSTVLHGRFPWIRNAFVGLALTSMLAFRVVSVREFQVFASNERSQQEGEKLMKLSPETLRKAQITLRNMALCTGSMFARAAVTPVIALSQPKKVKIIFGMLNFGSRCIVAYLLMQLRRATGGGFEAAVEERFTPTVRAELLQSQSSFFDKVAEVLQTEAIVKVVLTLVQVLRLYRHPS